MNGESVLLFIDAIEDDEAWVLLEERRYRLPRALLPAGAGEGTWLRLTVDSAQKLEAEQRATAEAEKRRLKKLHWMHCPKCGQKLTTELHGSVEVDPCPSCRGLWLDANELETILASESSFLQSCLKILRGG